MGDNFVHVEAITQFCVKFREPKMRGLIAKGGRHISRMELGKFYTVLN
jgi:hypothetical protein